MHQEILISVETQEKRVGILEDKLLEEFYVERQNEQRLVGNIYKAVVETVIPAIGAAFVNIGLPKNGFLYIQDLTQPDYEKIAEVIDKPYSYENVTENGKNARAQLEIHDMLKRGQKILVQVTKAPLGTKGPRLTTHIALPGRYLVLLPCDKHIGISRKIQNNRERLRLKGILKELRLTHNMGLIIRTAGEGGTKRQFVQDLRYLMGLWRKIKLSLKRKPSPALIHEEYDLVLRIIRDKFIEQTNRLLVDSKEEYKRIMRFLSSFSPNLRARVQYYFRDIPLFVSKGVDEEISRAYERKVYLKSGGHILLEPTESLVAIDVNSGSFTKKKELEETAYLVNLEAAREIVRQIRLRDIGGIIIIDFIDMKLPKHREAVFNVLFGALKRDYAKTDISAVSEFGLIIITRQRMRKSLENMVYRSCMYCHGKGLVKSQATMAILVLRKIKRILQTKPKQESKNSILIFLHPDVATFLVNQNRAELLDLEKRFKVKILVRENSTLHIERFKIELV